jgi:hypothetical protein
MNKSGNPRSGGKPPFLTCSLFRFVIPLGFEQKVLNPTHGSGWIGSGPFYTPVPEPPSNPTHGSGWILQLLRPKDLRHPPTAVGGIFGVFVQSHSFKFFLE